MEGLVGHAINAIAAQFAPLPELNALPSDCYSCIVRAARDMDASKRTLEVSVVSYLESHVGELAALGAGGGGAATSASAPRLSVEEFLDVVSAPGRMDDMRHAEVRRGTGRWEGGRGRSARAGGCERAWVRLTEPRHSDARASSFTLSLFPHITLLQAVYGYLELMLRAFKADEQAEALCKGLHELGFWICLPHVAIERAYADRNVPDRYCTVSLMAENRHLIKVNEQLAEQVEGLTEALRGASSGGGGGGGAPPALGY